jgi:hypothetical protein
MKVYAYLRRAMLLVVIAFEVMIWATEGIVPVCAYAAILVGPIVIWKWGRFPASSTANGSESKDGERSPQRETIKRRILRVLACIAFVYAVGIGLGMYRSYQTKVGHERAMERFSEGLHERSEGR